MTMIGAEQGRRRIGRIIKVRPEAIEKYREIHAGVWPEILQLLSRHNVTNYSIFLRQPENLLFAYLEYVGHDFKADMAAAGADEAMKRWWLLTEPMQEPLASRTDGEWWVEMEPVFHLS